MGDVGEDFKFFKQLNKERKQKRLDEANPEGWNIHTEYHWSRILNGKRLDYWPSKNKFQYDGKVMNGDVNKFVKKQQAA